MIFYPDKIAWKYAYPLLNQTAHYLWNCKPFVMEVITWEGDDSANIEWNLNSKGLDVVAVLLSANAFRVSIHLQTTPSEVNNSDSIE